MKYSEPVKLTSARAWRTYTGGSLIDAIHGIESKGDTNFPEEWIMSTVTARNPGREAFADEGMSFLQDRNTSLLDFIKSDPSMLLGEEHYRKLGTTTGVLTKIIDAAERLTVQVHPNREKALSLFNSQYGKTESWHILDGRTINGEKPCIYMGFREGITREKWVECFDNQDIPALLSLMHRFDVKEGETYLIRGGVPHAIGQGCLLIEIQEPTDYTIRVERVTPQGLRIDDRACHQGLGFERMFDCFEYEGISKAEAYRRWCIPPQTIETNRDFIHRNIIGYDSTPCFRLDRFDLNGTAGFQTGGRFFGLYIYSGSGELKGRKTVPVSAGDQFFVPASSDDFTITSTGDKPMVIFQFFGPEL